MNSCIHVHNNS